MSKLFSPVVDHENHASGTHQRSARSRSSSPRPRSPRSSVGDDESRISRSSFKDVPSRLHQTTVAVKNAQWTGKEAEPNIEIPIFSTAPVRRSSVLAGDISPRQLEKFEYHNNPYKDSVSSRLHSETAAAIHGKWAKETVNDANVGKSKNRRFSTSCLPAEVFSAPLKPLPKDRRDSDPYASVKPRLYEPTACAEHAKWTPSKAKTDSDSFQVNTPRFNSSVVIKHSPLAPPPPPVPKSGLYEEIGPRLHESTAARNHAKYNAPAPPTDAHLKGFTTTVRRGSVAKLQDFDVPPPIPENRKNPYKSVGSRLLEPTTASVEGTWKKPETTPSPPPHRQSLSPTNTSKSRLFKPTVSSKHNIWPRSPDAPQSPKEDRKPHLIKSKQYENVGSRLYNPTVASITKFAPDPNDEAPKEAFGHPIEPEYRKLVRKPRGSTSPSPSGGRRSSGGSGHSSSSSPMGSPKRTSLNGVATATVGVVAATPNGHMSGTASELDQAMPEGAGICSIARSETLEL